MEIKELTKAEEQIMQVLWDLGNAFVKDIIDELPDPKPAYNTVSTIVRILETKGFVDHEAFGKSHRYFAVISREEYKSFATDKLLSSYFGNSPEQLLSYFVSEKKLDLNDVNEILKMIDKLKSEGK